jgi:hypothetical protein
MISNETPNRSGPAHDPSLTPNLELPPPVWPVLKGEFTWWAERLRTLRQHQPAAYRAWVRDWVRVRYPNYSPLERHVAVFDPDGDGTLDLADTYRACREMGGTRWVAFKATVVTAAAISRLRWIPWSMPITRVAELAHPAVHSGGFRADRSEVDVEPVVLALAPAGRCPFRLARSEVRSYFSAVAAKSSFPRAKVRDAARISSLEWPVLLDFTNGHVDDEHLRSLFLGSLFFELLSVDAFARRVCASG